MGIVRINAISPSAVEYLLRGCDKSSETEEPLPDDRGVHGGDRDDGRSSAADRRRPGPGYFASAVRAGEPPGVWWGSGLEALDLGVAPGELAAEDDVRAIYGQLRYPTRVRKESTDETPVHIGRAPRAYRTLTERVEAALEAEPEATPERVREIEIRTSRRTRSNTAYYDVTFSPAKSVSIYYAALVAAQDLDGARRVRWAHDEAVRIAFSSVERDLAWAKIGRHGRAGPSGRTVGEWARGTGLSVVLFAHHANRDNEPQLHAHAAVLNRIALEDGRIYALDGAAFGPVKEALSTAYTRAHEQLVTEQTGAVFALRADGKAREIVGVDPALIAEGSTRTTDHVSPRVAELVTAYVDRHGQEPDQRARHRIAEMAVKATRQPKRGPAGPAAVAAWAAPRAERLAAMVDAVDEAALDAVLVSTTGSGARAEGAVAIRPLQEAVLESFGSKGAPRAVDAEDSAVRRTGERVRNAVESGLDELQNRYATWTVGNLVQAVDHELGDSAGALGLGARERPAFLRWVAERVLDPTSCWAVVQISGGDPVPVPDALRRLGPDGDGRSRFRAPIDERYSLATHLDREQRLLAAVRHGQGPRAAEAEIDAVRAALTTEGHSPDQVRAVTGVLASGRAVDVVVGPAGVGKSHTVAALARVWEQQFGARVLGTATAQIATRNLAGLGIAALNTARMRSIFGPTDGSEPLDQLELGELVVLDEAGTASTADLAFVTDLAARAGAKVVLVGDHRQLGAVEAGGMFARLAMEPGVLELTELHRFAQRWEADASRRLRAGEPDVATIYADHGRLRHGLLAEVQQAAVAGYLADRIEGKSSLLVVGTNEHATDLSRTVHRELVALGRVDPEPLLVLPSETEIAVGDVIQARRNDHRLRVEPLRRSDGSVGQAWPVTNRETYTVVGRDGATGDLLATDARGATAHLPMGYVQAHVTLAYAVTANAAQGMTVDVGRGILDRDADRASAYVPASRGREANILYLVTEQDPDDHDPQRIRDTVVGRLVEILGRDRAEPAAVTVVETAALEARSVATLAELFDRASVEHIHVDYANAIAEAVMPTLGADGATEVVADPAYGALLAAVRRADLGGYDVSSLVRRAVSLRSFEGVRSVAEVLHWRVERLRTTAAPDRVVDPADWTTFVGGVSGEVRDYLREVAARINGRQTDLGALAARDEPWWAVGQLGPVPDEGSARVDWEMRAGRVAGWREWRGIPDDQLSIGPLPPRSEQLARTVWGQVARLLPRDPHDVRGKSERELRQLQSTWARELEAVETPPPVAEELADMYRRAHDSHIDAVLGRARVEQLGKDHPDRDRLARAATEDEVFARSYGVAAERLEHAHRQRLDWWEDTTGIRDSARAATEELVRRGLVPRPLEAYDDRTTRPTTVADDLTVAADRLRDAGRGNRLERPYGAKTTDGREPFSAFRSSEPDQPDAVVDTSPQARSEALVDDGPDIDID